MTSDRLDFLLRQNAGRSARASWQATLERFGFLPDRERFLPLDQSDKIDRLSHQKFAPRLLQRANQVHARPASEVEPIPCFLEWQIPLKAINTLRREAPEEETSIHIGFRDSRIAGWVDMAALIFFDRLPTLIQLDPDGFVAVSADISNQLVCQVLSEGPEDVVDLAVWGARWGRVFAEHAKEYSASDSGIRLT